MSVSALHAYNVRTRYLYLRSPAPYTMSRRNPSAVSASPRCFGVMYRATSVRTIRRRCSSVKISVGVNHCAVASSSSGMSKACCNTALAGVSII